MMVEEDDDQLSAPERWGCPTLGELAQEERGITYGIVQPGHHVIGGVPIVRVQNIVDGTLETSDVMRVAPEIAAKYRRTCLRGGELLLSLVGSVGSSVIAPPEIAGWNTARAVAVVPLRAGIDARWVRFCLRSAPLQHLMEVWCNTTVQATLNLKDVTRLPIPLPPPREREAIVEVLGALDDKIELNRRMNRTLEDLAGALFRAWFVDFEPVVAKAAGRAPFGLAPAVAALFPATFTDSELGPIPHGWRVRRATELIEFNPTRRLAKNAPAPYLDMQNVPTNSALPQEWAVRPFGSGMKFQNGDTLLARITPCLENGKTAFANALADGEVGWGSTEFIVMHPRDPLPPEFGYFLARSDEFRAHAITNMTGSSGRQRVPVNCFETFLIAEPPAALARAFGRIADFAVRKMKGNVDESRTLAALRDTLLPKLLSGEIRVSAAEKLAASHA